MSNKHNPYLRLFTRDIEGSPKINSLSMVATGLYFRLLNRFNEPPMPGSLALHEWEMHSNWKRSLTQQCLAKASKYERLPYFAKYLSKIFQWKSAEILKALQELYFFGIIVVEDDRLIQPRMYRDNGYKLAADSTDDTDIDPATGALNNHLESATEVSLNDGDNSSVFCDDKKEKKNSKKNNKKTTQKNSRTHTRVHALSVENENNINNNSSSKIDSKAKSENSTAKKRKSVADNPPTLAEVQAYFDERAQQGRPFIYTTAESFFDACSASGWRLKDGKPMMDWQARVRTFENFRREHGDKPVVQSQPSAMAAKPGEAVPATPPQKNKFGKW